MPIKKSIATENQEQRALVKWLNLHPTLKNYYCKNNNEGKRTDLQGWNLKKMGLRPGVSDLLIYLPTENFHGLWLEVKRNRKYTRSEMMTDTWVAQEAFLQTVRGVGFAGHFCYGWEDGARIITEYMQT